MGVEFPGKNLWPESTERISPSHTHTHTQRERERQRNTPTHAEKTWNRTHLSPHDRVPLTSPNVCRRNVPASMLGWHQLALNRTEISNRAWSVPGWEWNVLILEVVAASAWWDSLLFNCYFSALCPQATATVSNTSHVC